MNNQSFGLRILVSERPRFLCLVLFIISLSLVLAGCQSQHMERACAEDEIWDGNRCITKEQMAQPCSELPEDQQTFCKEVVAKRIAFFKQYEDRFSSDEKRSMRDQIIREISDTGKSIQHYQAGVNYICAVSEEDVKCTELSSIAAFYDNEATGSLLDDVRALGIKEAKRGDVLLNCGNGVLSITNLTDIPGVMVPVDPTETPGPTDVPPDMEPPEDTDWWESVFSEAAGDSLNDMCDKLRNQASNGNTVVAALGLSPIGPDQCDAFAIEAPAFVDKAESIIADSLSLVGQACNSIMPQTSIGSDPKPETPEEPPPEEPPPEEPPPEEPPLEPLPKTWYEELADYLADLFSGSDEDDESTTNVVKCWEKVSGGSTCGQVTCSGNECTLTDEGTGKQYKRRYYNGTWVQFDEEDCLDQDMCNACLDMIESLAIAKKDCLIEGSTDPLCENLKTATDCCATDNDRYTDPRIVLPNPEGEYTCYAQLNPGEVQRQYCQDICGVASEHIDCVKNCLIKEHPVLEFDLLDNACRYMYSETCFERELPGGLGVPEKPGGVGPPTPYELGNKTFIPEVITRLDRPD